MSLARYLANLLNSSGQVEAAKLAATLDLSSKTLTYPDNSVQSADIASMAASKLSGQVPDVNAPSGSVIQVVQTVKTDTFSANGTSFVDITGLNVTITPSSATSRILIMVSLSQGEGGDAFPLYRLNRNGTTVVLSNAVSPGTQSTFAFVNTGADARDQYLSTQVNYTYLDSPASTSALTYQISVSPMRTQARLYFLNRPQSIGDANQNTATSTITVMEIAG